MRRLLPIGLLTLCFAITSQERASAWINSRFGVGFNWSWQSGGNNLLWGLFRDGQPPAPCPTPPCGPMPGCGPFMPGCPPMPGPIGPGYSFPGPHSNGEFPFFGRANTPAPQTQTAHNPGYNHPVGYSPAAARSYYQPAYYPYYGYMYPYRR